MCEKNSSFRDENPLSVSYFYPKQWKPRQLTDADGQIDGQTNGAANLQQPNTTGQTGPINSNRTLVHQIKLNDFKDENNRDACEFEMRIESINGQKLFDDDRSNHFTMEIKPERDGDLVNVYLNASLVPEEAVVFLSCTYKKVVLHRSELHFMAVNN